MTNRQTSAEYIHSKYPPSKKTPRDRERLKKFPPSDKIPISIDPTIFPFPTFCSLSPLHLPLPLLLSKPSTNLCDNLRRATMAPRKPLSHVLPPLILGTATFNKQYHPDPEHMPYTDIVGRALAHNILGFDTSPYYGPSEILLGDALAKLTPQPPREGYFLVTKAGRIQADEFDYSPSWIRYSVNRSLERLGTPYLDLVYTHDVEFVSPQEVLIAVMELRRLRDEGVIRYVGISGYPVETLASLAEMILLETGEPLDAVLSYSNFCVQNAQLGDKALLERFRDARVECVLNASMLGMGLLTTRGVDQSPMASWHPAPRELRLLCNNLADFAQQEDERLEEVAIRWALENWARVASDFGTRLTPTGAKLGVSVMGVSNVEELEETFAQWSSVVGLAEDTKGSHVQRKEKIERIVMGKMRPSLGAWKDYAWESGKPQFAEDKRQSVGAAPLLGRL